jgi:hypothetical protein
LTLVLSTPDQVFTNSTILVGAPAVRITAARVRFANSSELRSNASNQPAVQIDEGGGILTNFSSGVISGNDVLNQPLGPAIIGSAGNDRVDNFGRIRGAVALGGGDDQFLQRQPLGQTASPVTVDLGDGDDRFQLVGGGSAFFEGPSTINGGAGFDILRLSGTVRLFEGTDVSGFERLLIDGVISDIDGLSDLTEIQFAPTTEFLSTSFVFSSNPLVDLVIANRSITIGQGSAFRNVTGSDGTEHVSLWSSNDDIAALFGSADLGGGDDIFWVTRNPGSIAAPAILGTVAGGAGFDTLRLLATGGHEFDLAQYSGFEAIDTGTFTRDTSNLRLINLSGAVEVTGDPDRGRLVLAQSQAPQAVVNARSGTLEIEATATIGRHGLPNRPGFETVFDVQQQADQRFNMTVINRGTILGPVQLYYGNDVYDGTAGTTGGTIFGYAGDDRLRGGAGNERLEGGFGLDQLFGNGGDDVLMGGAGNDLIDGGSGRDTAVFSGARTEYQITRMGGTVTVAHIGTDGLDTITATERLQFSDGTLSVVPQQLVLGLAGNTLIRWDSTLGSAGFSSLITLGAGASVAGVADFSGDGAGDLLLNLGPGSFILWNVALGGAGFAELSGFGGFQTLGFGDLRGSVATDVLAISASRELRIFDVSTNSSSSLLTLSQGFSLVGVGNIDGVGKDDILFINDATRALFALTDGGWRDLFVLGDGWQVAGIADVINGPADDLVLFNENNRVSIFWDPTQGGNGWRDFATIAPGWSFKGFHDLDGDARTDVMLQNVGGEAIYWTGSNWGSLGSVLSGVQLVGTGEFV